jgi:hypothetical protein
VQNDHVDTSNLNLPVQRMLMSPNPEYYKRNDRLAASAVAG